ncbi:MAG: histidine decarboxylase [Chloroflexi bacterium]|nr:histidine decarboxylase [Chloroflexota bacterium]
MKEISREARARLAALKETYEEASAYALGYPVNFDFDYEEILPFLKFNANNVGDPFHGTNYRVNSHDFEREVVGKFANLMRLDPEDAWGYVTTGGTEGNMYGLYMARELHPQGVVYFSQDTHYSILKIMQVLNMRNIMIKSQDNGEIDYDDLYETIRINRDVPVIMMANIGTTMKGAVDDLRKVRKILDDLAIRQSYIHSDAALSGMILPFVADPQPYGFDEGADSLAVSGHKLIGSPIPCGVVLTRKEYVARISRSVEYVGVMDTTIPGSRNAWTPLLLWYALEKHGMEGLTDIVAEMLSVAEYAVQRFNDSGIPAWRHHNSVTVVFPRPPQEVVSKWQLAPYRDIAHLITMPHVTRQLVDQLVDECLAIAPATR